MNRRMTAFKGKGNSRHGGAAPGERIRGLQAMAAALLAFSSLALMGAAAAPAELPPWPPGLSIPGPAASAPTVTQGGWRAAGLPDDKAPMTRLQVLELDGQRVLDLQAQASYGTLVHDLPPGTPAGRLSWRWRLLQPNPQADLRHKPGDDSPLKVCASFELPLSAVPFMERQMLKLARSVTGQDLPAATLCYVWDSRLPAGTILDNAYSRRLRWRVLRGPDAPLGQWQTEQRDLAADFVAAFGDEVKSVPPLKAMVVGADADNTGGQSRGQMGALRME